MIERERERWCCLCSGVCIDAKMCALLMAVPQLEQCHFPNFTFCKIRKCGCTESNQDTGLALAGLASIKLLSCSLCCVPNKQHSQSVCLSCVHTFPLCEHCINQEAPKSVGVVLYTNKTPNTPHKTYFLGVTITTLSAVTTHPNPAVVLRWARASTNTNTNT